MIKRLLLVLSSLMLFGSMSPSILMACSGGVEFQLEDLSSMDLIVKATVIDTDDRGFNAIIRVEDYYKGEGDQLLVIMRYPVGLETGNKVRGYATSCLYSGHGKQWQKGSQGYFGLNSNADGTFNDLVGWNSAHFYVWDGQITFDEGATTGYALEHNPFSIMSEADFLVALKDMGGHDEPLPPTIEGKQVYPLMRFLNITSEKGTRYQVNPDRSVIQLPDSAPLAISPDGAHVAFKLDENTIAFQPIWTEYKYVDETSELLPQELMEENQKAGMYVRFSNDSNMVAVWDYAQLTVYLFGRQEFGYFGNQLHMREIVSINIAASTRVIWSADSSTLAWEDTSGVWRWNLFEDAEAMHLTESYSLLDVSTYGRYVRVGQADEWTLYDTQTGETFANAISAPTEQFLIFVNSDETPINDWQSADDCKPPLRETCAVYINPRYDYETFSVFPYQMELFGIKGCSSESCDIGGVSWHPSIGENSWRGDRYIYVFKAGVRQIIYDVFYDQVAILAGDYQIEFDFYPSDYFDLEARLAYLDYLNLEDEIDSPIASIEWGQAIFYDTFMLTGTQYLP